MDRIIFELEDILISYFDKEIIKIDRLAVHQFDRIGIVGKNGAGKSTIIKLLAGEIVPTTGKVIRHVEPAYFEQLSAPQHTGADGELLSKLGISGIEHNSSGGEQAKLKLANVFTDYYEALLLDEPTTHMDQAGISFLIEQLEYYYGAMILVSHDRSLLDQVVTTIWEVADGVIRVYKGNYSDYEKEKNIELKQIIEAHEKYTSEKNRLEMAIQKKKEKAEKLLRNDGKSKQKAKEKPSRLGKSKSKSSSQKAIYRAAKSMEHRIKKLDEIKPIQEERPIIFNQSKSITIYNKFPIMATGFKLTIGNRVLIDEANFQFPLGKKIAITGPNGSGKSTFLNHIANKGDGLIISPKVKIGYFTQMGYRFNTNETILSYLKNRSEQSEGILRTILHKMQFSGTDLYKKVNDISGGEAVRLRLCELFLGEFNVLLLDEPTNFLDIHAREALETFIHGYSETIISVSHDKAFIANVADVQYEINPRDKTFTEVT
ncbi:ribosomal protection-like ABC-F family protein [Ornithinibacillus halotolerans]|uniref:Msr family ABC-F type ribosomal protection protein n=1 Tax=Ornithinibacillus halotolerans TaxID=1274357 RepID=A0A916S303_9BACI|nr:ABC-F type ribosomal protection protein [Ornithinibacillus halotolerans]GGA81888.1 Msr family ABC-F type ribosomal protection protein [Ornithinibacillus halotolerans]